MGSGLVSSSTEKDRKWTGIIGRREIFGKIPLINYVYYLTNDCIGFDWTAAAQPDIHRIREYGRNFIHE